MTTSFDPKLSRRSALAGLAALGAAGLSSQLLGDRRAHAAEKTDDPRFLIVIGGSGGASIIDAAMAIRASECKTPDVINTYEDALVTTIDGSPFRALDQKRTALGPIPQAFTANQSDFVKKHYADMMVATWRRTSVNHAIGQARAVTGNDAWRGRTLQEAVALEYGEGFALPNVNLMAGTGFTKRGIDDSLPAWCFGEQVAAPGFWPLSLDAHRGVKGAPARSVLDKARALRERLEKQSAFVRVYARNRRLAHWQHLRGDPVRALEAEALIDKLMVGKDSEKFPLSAYGLTASPDAERLYEVFPKIDSDPLEAQAALAFLLLKNRVSVSVTLGPSFNVAIAEGVEFTIGGGGGGGKGLPEGAIMNPPIAFDFSHQEHRSVQAFMWGRIYGVMDRLIGLLKSEEWAGGQSLWDRSMMYLATDFGRTKNRPAGSDEFGSGHDLDNGALVVSPLANGNRILGGVNPDTGLTFGFDPTTGTPDPNRLMEEKELYAGILHGLGVDTAGSDLPDMPAMRRAS
jgi:hypothetical protein